MNVADDFEAIRRRQEEIAAEKDIALKGTSAPAGQPEDNDPKVPSGYAAGWPMYNSLHAPVADNEYGGI